MRQDMAGTVLIVEDNAMNRTLLRDVLVYHGYSVLEAENGVDGLSMAKEHLPDVVLLDIQMPLMDGFRVLKGLRGSTETGWVPVIALTSCAMCGDKERILAAGFDGFIAKPIDTRMLPSIIQDAMAKVEAMRGTEVERPGDGDTEDGGD
jgi:two-component system cell cycle response regulator DivK